MSGETVRLVTILGIGTFRPLEARYVTGEPCPGCQTADDEGLASTFDWLVCRRCGARVLVRTGEVFVPAPTVGGV